MSKLGDRILRELEKVPDRSPQIKGDNVWIRCPNPDHSGGQESTPSMAIQVEDGGNHKVGFCFCFGCGFKTFWSRGIGKNPALADVLKLNRLDKFQSFEVSPVFSKKSKQRLLRGEDEQRAVGAPRIAIPWPEDKDWRGIQGTTLRHIGAKYVYDKRIQDTRIALPVRVSEDQTEWIYGLITRRSKKQIGYIYSSGPWIRKALFPVPLVEEGLEDIQNRVGKRIVAIVEGSRDALNLIQLGLPALAVLATHAADDPDKITQILDLEPDLVIIATDPDSAGNMAAKKLKRALKQYMPTVRWKMKDGRDPADMKQHDVDVIVRKSLKYLETK